MVFRTFLILHSKVKFVIEWDNKASLKKRNIYYHRGTTIIWKGENLSQATFYDLYPPNYSLIQKLQKDLINKVLECNFFTYTIINIQESFNKM